MKITHPLPIAYSQSDTYPPQAFDFNNRAGWANKSEPQFSPFVADKLHVSLYILLVNMLDFTSVLKLSLLEVYFFS